MYVHYQLKHIKCKGLQRARFKSGKSRRVLPLPEVAARALQGWKLVLASEERAPGARWIGNVLGLVFTTQWGAPPEPGFINRSLRVLSLAGVHSPAVRDALTARLADSAQAMADHARAALAERVDPRAMQIREGMSIRTRRNRPHHAGCGTDAPIWIGASVAAS